jgi:type IV pilus assembly protein PilA
MFKKLGSKLKEQKGFTLIELLAVIVILGIIAAIAIPAISNVISKSETKATAQEGVSIINAAKMYVAEHPGNEPTTLGHTALKTYLDHSDDTTYTVTIGQDASGKFSYSLTAGTTLTDLKKELSSGTLSELTEQELINISKGTSVADVVAAKPTNP